MQASMARKGQYTEHVAYVDGSTGFKRSSDKKKPECAFLPTNLHIQVQGEADIEKEWDGVGVGVEVGGSLGHDSSKWTKCRSLALSF